MKTSPWRVCAATSCFSATLPGESGGLQAGSVLVEDAHGAAPNVPFWRGEAPARTAELSEQVAELRQRLNSLTETAGPGTTRADPSRAAVAVDWLMQECGLDRAGAEQAVEYVIAGRAVLRAVPTQQTMVAERFFDESGGMQLVIHAPFGGTNQQSLGSGAAKALLPLFQF